MALFGTKEERQVKKLLKNYKNLYDKLFYIEKVGKSIVKELHEVTESQMRVHLKDIEIACVNIDAAMRELSEKDNKLYQKFFNEIPKFSSFDQGADFISGDSKMFILPEHNTGEKIKVQGKEWREYIEKHKNALMKKIRYVSFLKKEAIDLPEIKDQDYSVWFNFFSNLDVPKKLKGLILYDIREIEKYHDNFNNFFYKTYEMMYNNFVFAEIPNDFSDETLEVHSIIQFFIDKGVIDKENPYKVAVYELPDIIKPYSSQLGLFTVQAQR